MIKSYNGIIDLEGKPFFFKLGVYLLMGDTVIIA